jgi:hypothetical protein
MSTQENGRRIYLYTYGRLKHLGVSLLAALFSSLTRQDIKLILSPNQLT